MKPELVQPADPALVPVMVALMDAADRTSLTCMAGDPVAAIADGVARSTMSWMGVEGEEPLCMGGVVAPSLLCGEGLAWMVSQPRLRAHKRVLLRETRRMVTAMRELHPRLTACVGVDYPESLRWLEWAGFTLGDEIGICGTRARVAEYQA